MLLIAGCGGDVREGGAARADGAVAGSAASRDYVGDAACAACHAEIADAYGRSKKGRSLVAFTAHEGPERFDAAAVVDTASGLRYEAILRDGRLVQRETRRDPEGRLLHELEFAADLVIGSGNQTRSYLLIRDGRVTQMPLTWYSQRERWDLSPGYHEANDRFSRMITVECLNCHGDVTVRTPYTQNHFERVPEAISCERCHGPGSAHVDARSGVEGREAGGVEVEGAGDAGVRDGGAPGAGDPTIVNPTRLDRDGELSVCAQCHMAGIMSYVPGEAATTFLPGEHLARNRTVHVPELQLTDPDWVGIDSHPVRLARSACFAASEMTCSTCHAPHTPDAELPPDHYDTRCVSCHTAGSHGSDRLCTRPEVDAGADPSEGSCVSCHMQSGGTSDVPHVRFTDHWIRRVPGPPLSPDAGRPVVDSPEPLRLVPLSPRGLPAPPGLYAHLSESVRLAGEAEAYFHFWETMHRHPGYIQTVVDVGRRALEEGPGTIEGSHALGRALLEAGSVAEAETVFREALVRAPENPWTHLFLGALLDERRGRPAEALGHLERAVALQPELQEARRKLAEVLYTLGRRDDAEEQLRDIVRRDPIHEPRSWFNLGVILREAEDTEGARRAFGEASRLSPDLADAHLELGGLEMAAQRIDAAERAFRAAIAAAPDAPGGHGSLALVHLVRGETGEARRRLQRVLELDPGHAAAQSLLRDLDARVPPP
jgi:tetratricopeptide (TPR) repeat protein